MAKQRETTWLLATLSGLLVIVVVIVVVARRKLLVSWPVIAAVAVPWVGLSIVLRVRQADWGREGKYVDWWSVPHFGAGVLFALFGIGVVWVAALAITWELVEVFAHVREFPANRALDVVLALGGWTLTMAICGGSFTVL